MPYYDDEEPMPQVLDEEPVVQVDFDDTIPMVVPFGMRASTCTDWPPAPPAPELDELDELDELVDDLDLAAGTGTDAQPVWRNAGIFAAVRRPTTNSGES